MAAPVESIAHIAAIQDKSLFVNEKDGGQIYGIVLNAQHCTYKHDSCVKLNGITVTGSADNLADKNKVTAIVQTANEVFLKLRYLNHTYSKPNDDHRIPTDKARYETALAAYEKAKKETGLSATSSPALTPLK